MFYHKAQEKGNVRYWLEPLKWLALHAEFGWGKHKNLHFEVGYDDEHGWELSFSLLFISVYLFVDIKPLRLRESREVSLKIHGGSIWWTLWRDPMGEWSCKVPRWRCGNFSFDDFFLGKSTCSRTTLEERDVLIPMPEKSYEATAKLIEFKWTRPRWFSKILNRVDIEVPEGIPHEGKGTSAHNCGVDATYSMCTGECHSIPQGVGKLVGLCLQDRVNYGGWGDYKWTKPRDNGVVLNGATA